MLKYEKKIINWIIKNYLVIAFIAVTGLALVGRFYAFPFASRDYNIFLSGWFDQLKANGGILALADYPGDYNAPYVTILALLTYLPFNKLYLIKIVSVMFDFGLAISSACLVKYLAPKNKTVYAFFAYAFILFAPEVVMNSSLWAQCDSGYTMFIVLSLLFLFKDKYIMSFILLGVAFSLKLQFVFILPLYIVVYIFNKKFSIFHFLLIPLVNIVLSLPAIIVGMPISKIFDVYINQVSSYDYALSLNFLNLYSLITENGTILNSLAIITTIVTCGLMLVYLIYKNVKLNPQKMLNLGLWFVVISTFLLPRMHDRYLYVGGVLAIIYYILYKKNFLLMLNVILASIITYFGYLFSIEFPYRGLFVVMYFIVIAYYTRDLVLMLRDDGR